MDSTKFCIFVPCYNVEKFVVKTIKRVSWEDLPKELKYTVVFVDNHSSDNTWEQIQECLRFLKTIGVEACAIRNQENLGYGGSNKLIFDYCIQRNIDSVGILHSDGQYLPKELPRLIRKFLGHPHCALYYGSRLKGSPLKGGMPFYKFLANVMLTWIQNRALGSRYSEFHSGYRFYRMSKIKRLRYTENSNYYHFDTQIMFQIHHAGETIEETAIPTFYGEEKSYLSAITCASGILANALLYVFHNWGVLNVKRFENSSSVSSVSSDVETG